MRPLGTSARSSGHARGGRQPATPAASGGHHLLDLELTSFPSPEEAAEHAVDTARRRRRGSSVFTCNVDHLMVMTQRHDFLAAYRRADLITVDGAPLALLCRQTGAPTTRRTTGIDLSLALAEIAARDGLRVALVGGLPGRAELAADQLRQQFGLDDVFCVSPRFGFRPGDEDDHDIVAALRWYAPDIVIVCLGAPKQELWIDLHRAAFPGAVLVGAGATIDVLSGCVRRAPSLFRRTGTEAVYRLATDFTRLWRRYLVRDVGFLAFFPLVVARYRATHRGWATYSPAHAAHECPGAAMRRGRGCAVAHDPAPIVASPVSVDDLPRVDIGSVREAARSGGSA